MEPGDASPLFPAVVLVGAQRRSAALRAVGAALVAAGALSGCHESYVQIDAGYSDHPSTDTYVQIDAGSSPPYDVAPTDDTGEPADAVAPETDAGDVDAVGASDGASDDASAGG